MSHSFTLYCYGIDLLHATVEFRRLHSLRSNRGEARLKTAHRIVLGSGDREAKAAGVKAILARVVRPVGASRSAVAGGYNKNTMECGAMKHEAR